MQGALYEWMGVPKRATCPPTTAGAFIQKPWLHHTLSSSSSMVGDSVRQESGVELAKVECRSQGHRSGRGCGLCRAAAASAPAPQCFLYTADVRFFFLRLHNSLHLIAFRYFIVAQLPLTSVQSAD